MLGYTRTGSARLENNVFPPVSYTHLDVYKRQGLEDTMIKAYHDIREFYKSEKNLKDLRTAAFAVSINKIKDAYYAMGIFP